MQINNYHSSQQIEPAEDLKVQAPKLPPILNIDELDATAPDPPPQLVEGILHKGCKMILGGTSKSNKSWSLLDLALSVASGQPWWGRPTVQAPVIYINFELQEWSIKERLKNLRRARNECNLPDLRNTLHTWNLRGYNTDLSILRPQLEEQLAREQYGLIIMDPAYKVLGGRDENSNGEIANLMNELEALARGTGAAVVIAHHYAKGDSTPKQAIDRMSGAGAWARDPDSILVLTPHEEPDCFTVTSILRNLPQLPEFVLRWDFPLMRTATDLNPRALRRPQSRNKKCTDKEFMLAVLSKTPRAFGEIVEVAKSKFNLGRTSTQNYLTRLGDEGLIALGNGSYWIKEQESSETSNITVMHF